MKIHWIATVTLLLTVWMRVSSIPVCGAYLEDDSGSPVTRDVEIAPPIHRPMPRPPLPPPDTDNPLRRMLRQVEIGRPAAYGRLTVFPLEIGDPMGPPAIRSLDEALSQNWITIREYEESRVSAVIVRNESRQTVFMMAGEILGGGRQDRILQKDVLLTPGLGAIAVPVYCGEQDRWKGTRDSFDRAPEMAGQTLRRLAVRENSQSAIWTEIDQQIKAAGVSAPTRSYQSLYNDPDVGRRITDRVERFRHIRTRRTVGLVTVASGRVVSADLFGDADLCAALWDKIMRSHVADYPQEEHWRKDREMVYDNHAATVKRFLDELSRTGLSRQHTPGAGESFAIRGRMDGQVLTWKGGLVHAAVFAAGDYREIDLR
ncbi:MAG: hypothetical protein FJ222_01365 [Lentisphaerae bacterium]|nr:hypothetical protein [Lentisphaerota bacterium]